MTTPEERLVRREATQSTLIDLANAIRGGTRPMRSNEALSVIAKYTVRNLATQVWAGLALFDEWQEKRLVIAEEAIKQCDERTIVSKHEVAALAKELQRQALLFLHRFWPRDVMSVKRFTPHFEALEDSRDPDQERDGMLAIDAAGADFLEELGESGREWAGKLRQAAIERYREYTGQQQAMPFYGNFPTQHALWCLWAETTNPSDIPTFSRILARVLWVDVVKKRIERERRSPPALELGQTRTLIEVVFTHGMKTAPDGDKAKVLRCRDGEILAAGIEAPLAERLVKVFGSMTGHRVIRHLFTEAHREWLDQDGPARLARNQVFGPGLIIDGGIRGLAERVGERGRKGADNVARVLDAGRLFQWSWPGGDVYGLWTMADIDHHAPGVARRFSITFNEALMPSRSRRERWLAPVVELPPRVGNKRNLYSSQATFQMLLVSAFVHAREQLATCGGALMQDDDLARLAKSAGMPDVKKVIDRWCQDGDDDPAFLERVEKDRYHIADNETHGSAREFLTEGGRRSIRGRELGKRGKEKKARRLR